MKDLKGYEDVVNQMTAKLAHACGIIKTKLTQESPNPVGDFEISREGATKATITFHDGWFLFGETAIGTQRLHEVLEEAISSDPENLRYCLEKDYSCGGLVKIELQDHSKYLGNYEIKAEENKKQTYTDKPVTTMFCPTCNIPMLQCQSNGGGFYWICGKCGCEVERTGL